MATEIVNATNNLSPIFYIVILTAILIIVSIVFFIKKLNYRLKVIPSLKPNWKKVVISIVVTALFLLLINFLQGNIYCKICSSAPQNCLDYRHYSVIPITCKCSCYTLNEMIIDNIRAIIIPFIVIYLIYSLGEIFFRKK